MNVIFSYFTLIERIFFFKQAKLGHPNWHGEELNLRPWGGEHSQVILPN